MLVINTESPNLSKHKKIYVFLNDELLDTIKPNEVKKYPLEKGEYNVHVKIDFYQSEKNHFTVKNKERHIMTVKYKENFRFILSFIIFGGIGLLIDFYLRKSIGDTISNYFISIYFILLYFINYKVNKFKYLKLIKN